MPKNLLGLEKYKAKPSLDAEPFSLPKKGPGGNKDVRKRVLGRRRSWLKNFQCVLFGRVYRSAAPGYTSGDTQPTVHEKTLEFLKDAGFKRVISLNSKDMNPKSQEDLRKANITYVHLPTVDFTPIKEEHFRAGVEGIDSAKSLVYCGYGEGRTGSLVAAWAGVYVWKRDPAYFLNFSADDMLKFLKDFGVETEEQKETVFAWLWDRLPLYQCKKLVADLEANAASTDGGAKSVSGAVQSSGKSNVSLASGGTQTSFTQPGPTGGSGNGIYSE